LVSLVLNLILITGFEIFLTLLVHNQVDPKSS
jgi:hypothetical protein